MEAPNSRRLHRRELSKTELLTTGLMADTLKVLVLVIVHAITEENCRQQAEYYHNECPKTALVDSVLRSIESFKKL